LNFKKSILKHEKIIKEKSSKGKAVNIAIIQAIKEELQ
jgi:hypothetical protein